jgi:hypothetical protein
VPFPPLQQHQQQRPDKLIDRTVESHTVRRNVINSWIGGVTDKRREALFAQVDRLFQWPGLDEEAAKARECGGHSYRTCSQSHVAA